MSVPRLNLIVAACNNNGIGKNGALPWSLRKDMDFFKKITTQTKDPDKKNAVIMGRKTWFSIPEKFRPLKGRINVVLSRELKEVPEGVYISRSLPEAIDLLTGDTLKNQIENIHVIGGSSVYQEAMNSCSCRLYLTRILADFDCDTYLPEINEDVFRKIENPPSVPTELQEEKDIKFRFEVYDKMERLDQMLPADRMKTPEKGEPVDQRESADQPMKINIMSAMCHNNRGIAKDLKLPWPPLRRDYEYFTAMVSSPRSEKTDGKIIHIRGRHTWECCGEEERSLPNVYHIVVSQTLSNNSHPRLLTIVSSFDDAISLCSTKPLCDEIDSVWAMGGTSIYEQALGHSQCDRLYLTHVYKDYPADTFFPEFEHNFIEIRHERKGTCMTEENGVKYEFKIYQKKTDS